MLLCTCSFLRSKSGGYVARVNGWGQCTENDDIHNTSRWIQTVKGESLKDRAPKKRSEVVISTEASHRDAKRRNLHTK